MNITQWCDKILNLLSTHENEINNYYKKHYETSTSTITTDDKGVKVFVPSYEVENSKFITKIYKTSRKVTVDLIEITIISSDSDRLTIKSSIEYYIGNDIFLRTTMKKVPTIHLIDDLKNATVIGGSPTFRYSQNGRWFWNEIFDKDIHFNESINNKLISYDTYLVMKEIYPHLPSGTMLSIKELFND